MLFDEDTVESAVQDAAAGAERQGMADKAFNQAQAGFELFGVTLASYSPSRKVAAQGMGMLYPYVGEGGAAQMEQTGMYAGVVKDVMILCWLCTLPDADRLPPNLDKSEAAKVWTPSRALNRPFEAMDAALGWGIEHNIQDIDGAPFTDAYKVFMAIINGISASEFALRLAKEKSTGGPPAPTEPMEELDPKA